jgi:hypothetical protein
LAEEVEELLVVTHHDDRSAMVNLPSTVVSFYGEEASRLESGMT